MLATIHALTVVLAVLAVVTVLAPRLRIPAPIALALAGIGLGYLPIIRELHIDPNWVLLGFLPPLLYADAFHTSWRDFVRWLRPIVMLAVGLVAVTILVVGLVAKWMLPDLPWPACFILGAVVSPTDTVAAQSVIERLRVPRRITAILGGESLVNDATGLVGVQFGVVVALSGVFMGGQVLGQFAVVTGAGVASGVAVGWLATIANRRLRDSQVLFTSSLLAPYLAFGLAHELGGSGVLAAVTAGFVTAWRIHRVAATSRIQLRAAWDQVTFLLNGLCFVYIGVETPRLLQELAPSGQSIWRAAFVVSATVILLRLIWCYPLAYLPLWLMPRLRIREGGYPPVRGVTIVAWCGMRGAVSLAAALSVPALNAEGSAFPGRNEILVCALTVILVTLFVQGLTLHPLVKLLRVPDDLSTEQDRRHARERLLVAGMARLDEFCSEVSCPVAVHRFRAAMDDQLAALRADDLAQRQHAEQRLAISREVRAAVFTAQERELLALRDRGLINDKAYAELLMELDMSLMEP